MIEIDASTKDQIIRDFERTYNENTIQLDFVASTVKAPNIEPAPKRFFELCFYIISIDNDIRMFIKLMLQDPQVGKTLEKYLGLLIHEAIVTVPKLTNNLIKEATDNPPIHGKGKLDSKKIKLAYSEYRKAIMALSDNSGFISELKNTRNSVAAHHLGKDGQLTGLVEWHIAQQGNSSRGSVESDLVEAALKTGSALRVLAHNLMIEFKSP